MLRWYRKWHVYDSERRQCLNANLLSTGQRWKRRKFPIWYNEWSGQLIIRNIEYAVDRFIFLISGILDNGFGFILITPNLTLSDVTVVRHNYHQEVGPHIVSTMNMLYEISSHNGRDTNNLLNSVKNTRHSTVNIQIPGLKFKSPSLHK